MSRFTLGLAGSVFLSVLLVFALIGRDASDADAHSGRTIHLYCAASNRAVMEQVIADYTQDFDQPIQVQYGPSQALLSSIVITRSGDLYLPADASYLDLAAEKNLLSGSIPLATMRAVLAVRKGNPKRLGALADLNRSDVTYVLANHQTAAIGIVVQRAMADPSRWQDLTVSAIALRTSVTEVANDVSLGVADAGIVYASMLSTYPDLEAVEIEELASATSTLSIGILNPADQSSRIDPFIDYLTSQRYGLKRYREFGFDVLDRVIEE